MFLPLLYYTHFSMGNLLMCVSLTHIRNMILLSCKAPSRWSGILSQCVLFFRNRSNQRENTTLFRIQDGNAIVSRIYSKSHLLLLGIHWASALSIHTSSISFDAFFDSWAHASHHAFYTISFRFFYSWFLQVALAL